MTLPVGARELLLLLHNFHHRHVPGCGDFPQTCQWWLDNLSSKWVGELLAEAMEKAMEKHPGTCGAGEVSGQPPNYEAARPWLCLS